MTQPPVASVRRTKGMMHANIANFVRQDVRVSKRKPLLPVFEAVSNALDAITDRKSAGTIQVQVLRHPDQLDGGRGDPYGFIVKDNGIGFTKENIDSFDEIYSVKKLSRGGKGRGRFSFLKVFDRAEITSTFKDNDARKSRSFIFNVNYPGFNQEPNISSGDVGSVVSLVDMRPDYAAHVSKTARGVAREFVSHFLPMFLSDRPVEIVVDDGEKISLTNLIRRDLLIEKDRKDFSIGSRTFSLVKLRPHLSNLHHQIILAASSRQVSGQNLDKLIPVLPPGPLELDGEVSGFYFVSIVQGEFLDQAVDPMRVAFTDEEDETETPEDETPNLDEPLVPKVDLFGEPQSVGEIRRESLKIIRVELASHIDTAVAHRSKAMENYIRRDGMGYHFIKSEIPELAKNLKATDDRSIESYLHAAAYIERRKRAAQAGQLLSASPKEKSEDAYFRKWTAIVDGLA
jgi:Histidine kinase-, DNA gyrase B-, and HSP90-like ATPase